MSVRTSILCMALLLGACASKPEQTAQDPYLSTRNDRCYTVDLFTAAPIQRPAREVPSDWQAFSGRWGGGAWAGAWCHDLYVLEIRPTGDVTVIDTHAPLPEWGKPATAFKRSGRIDSDGRLRMAFGNTKVEYWIEDGLLRGIRNEGKGDWKIAMARR